MKQSFKNHCYVLSRTREQNDQNLAREGKPETIEKLYNEASQWTFFSIINIRIIPEDIQLRAVV